MSVSIGFVGLGYKGSQHLAEAIALDGTNVIALCDNNKRRLTSIATQLSSVRAVLNDAELYTQSNRPDLVVVSVPPSQQKAITCRALVNGCHVFCEKPLGLNTDEALAIVETAERYNRRLCVGLSLRAHPSVAFTLSDIATGTYGGLVSIRAQWRRNSVYPGSRRATPSDWMVQKGMAGGGALTDLGFHLMDLCLHLAGHPEGGQFAMALSSKILETRAKELGSEVEVEDTAFLVGKLGNGILVSIEASWMNCLTSDEVLEYEVIGTRKALFAKNLVNKHAIHVDTYERIRSRWTRSSSNNDMNQADTIFVRFVKSLNDEQTSVTPYYREIRNLFNCLSRIEDLL